MLRCLKQNHGVTFYCFKTEQIPLLDDETLSEGDLEILNTLSTPGRPVYLNHSGKTDRLHVKKFLVITERT